MGVEYRHCLLASGDAVDDFEVLKRLDASLRELGVSSAPSVYDVRGGRCREVGSRLETAAGLTNVMLCYGELNSAAAPGIVGPSAFDLPDAERYLQDVVVIVGDEYRVFAGDEGLFVECASAVEHADLRGISYEWCEAGPRPQATVDGDETPNGFDGLFRTCIAFDCGKDMPAFVMDGAIGLDRAVVAPFEQALGRRVFELGQVY